jgi:transposase
VENARLRGLPDPEQLALAELRALEHRRALVLRAGRGHAIDCEAVASPTAGARTAAAADVAGRRTVSTSCRALDRGACPACGGALTEMPGQTEDSERITTVKLTYQVEHHHGHKYRCACNGAVVTAPGPNQVIAGGRYAPECGMGVAVAKYTDHLPLERQVRMMPREGLHVDSQTLWDQLQAMARHLEPTYDALGRRALEASVFNVD